MEENFSEVISIFKSFFPSRELCDEGLLAYKFISSFLEIGHQSVDLNYFNIYKQDVHRIENKIIEYICKLNNLEFKVEYVSLYRQNMNANTISNHIVFDELLIYTVWGFYTTVFSLVDDSSDQNFERCIKNIYVLLDLQGLKHQIGCYSIEEVTKMLNIISDNMLHRIMDCFWVTWAFLVSHELYHIKKNSSNASYNEEMEADLFAYKTIINLIMTQKRGELPEEIKVFYEDTYLAPIMLFNYFELFDAYCILCGKEVCYDFHPSPQKRQEQIFNLFDDCIPDDMDTWLGNEVLNTFLENSDALKRQITYKKRLGKI